MHDVSDLCIGKPALTWLPPTATVADAIADLETRGNDAAAAVWDGKGDDVAGRVSMVDVILFLCHEHNLDSPSAALHSSLADLLAVAGKPPVRRIDPHASVVEAVDAFLDGGGASCLVVPIRERRRSPAAAAEGKGEKLLCWLTVEDVVRFFLGCIGVFSATASLSVTHLGVVRPASLAVAAADMALPAVVPLLRAAVATHSSVAVLTGQRLAGEVSPSTLCSLDPSLAAAAIAALSAGDLAAFLHRGGGATIHDIRCRLRRRNLHSTSSSSLLSSSPTSSSSATSSSSSSDDDDEEEHGFKCYATASCARRGSKQMTEAIACRPGSSLVAVMVQAIAHRVTQVWVVDDGGELVGVVRFLDVLRVLRHHLQRPIFS
uniref:CBS domain-containing protein n=1 Tax=Leersia perrieri TaxID=77586 RepID=A0A0D9WB94_9ORYZ